MWSFKTHVSEVFTYNFTVYDKCGRERKHP